MVWMILKHIPSTNVLLEYAKIYHKGKNLKMIVKNAHHLLLLNKYGITDLSYFITPVLENGDDKSDITCRDNKDDNKIDRYSKNIEDSKSDVSEKDEESTDEIIINDKDNLLITLFIHLPNHAGDLTRLNVVTDDKVKE